jgi:UDP-glucose 4-epimerase
MCSYGITKLAVEKYTAMYAKLNGVEYRICRPANIYGEGQRLNIGQGVIGVFLERALKGQPIEIWGDGTNRRDYLYVKDMIDAIMKLMRHEEQGRVFNVSTGIGYSLHDIVRIIREELNIPVKVLYKSIRGFDVPENILSSKRLQNETGWKGTTGLVEGMRLVAEEKK